ncbi:MAG TPA: pyridoxal phosphate-dependent aminotransferase [Saprospiraceae bacterium]|nr:pyridoxal phosphate-dependent aminotransferase [Saprospiraceae bacterium]HNT18893.1 pyridoxal phosphate-dependent aminotransferase [Saprospiraceae bacterium]
MSSTAIESVLSDRVMSMTESATLQMAGMARKMKEQGIDVITLSLGEPDFDTPQHIKDAALKAMEAGHTKYTAVAGNLDLREAICAKLKRENGLDFKPSQIVVSNGAKQDIANLCLAMINPGDEVIILSPYWVSYSDIVKMCGGEAVVLSAGVEEDFKVPASRVEAAISDRTKLIMFSSPCNPTGSVFNEDELKAIAEVVARHENLYIMSDEIYEHINFTGKHISIASFPEVKDRTIVVNGFSKAFAMTGWRLGYMAAPQFIADACVKIQGQMTSGANSIAQKAGVAALNSDLRPTQEMTMAFRRRRDLIISLLKEIPGFKCNFPTGAFYIFPDISAYFGKSDGVTTIHNSDDFSLFLLNQAHVATVGGSAFGDDHCFRISYAASEDQIREAVRRIKEAVSKLK